MNSWQFFQQLRFLLQAAKWPTSNESVFAKNQVMVTADLPADFVGRGRLPCCLIRVQDATSDPEHDEEPDLELQTFDVTIACAVPNDPYGQAAFLGANRQQNSSAGKGVLEIQEQLTNTIKALGSGNGVRIISRGKGAAAGELYPELGYLAWRTFRYEAELSANRSYPAPYKLSVSVDGLGQVTLNWRNPALRYDSRKILLVRKAGAAAPTSPTDGTNVALAADFSNFKVDTSVPAGVTSYAVFATYDEYGTNTDAQYAAATKTVTVT